LSVQRCARQTKDENEPSKEIFAGQFAGPSIELRTSLIFSHNLAQRIERGISNPSLQSFESDFFNRTSLEATANVYTFNGTPDWDLSQSDARPRPLTLLTGELPSAPYTNIRPTTSATSTRGTSNLCSVGTSHEGGRRGGSGGSSNTSLTSAYQIPKTLRLNLRRYLGRVDQEVRPSYPVTVALPFHEGESNETVADLASRN